MIQIPYGVMKPSGKTISPLQQSIYQSIKDSQIMYHYFTQREMLFELRIRENIVKAAFQLNESKVNFSGFENSTFNKDYWEKTESGYRLKKGIKPSDGIRDVFINSGQYIFECVTSIVIIYYKAVLESIQEHYFNYLFSHMIVWAHNYDKDLGMYSIKKVDLFPGDVVYFYNPEYEKPIWMGENCVYLGNELFFGHGIGVGTADEVIEALNSLRKTDATESAYLLPQVTRLDFRYLSRYE
jgi:protein-glutamine gamma-glutamyltransferase